MHGEEVWQWVLALIAQWNLHSKRQYIAKYPFTSLTAYQCLCTYGQESTSVFSGAYTQICVPRISGCINLK